MGWISAMNVKEVVTTAKHYLNDLLADENVINLGLEEIDMDESEHVWRVTLGFSRPWNTVTNALTAIAGDVAAKRSYRVLTIRDADGAVTSVKRRYDDRD